MDEQKVLYETLNTMMQRHAKVSSAYEVEIANLTAEIVRLRQKIEELEKNED